MSKLLANPNVRLALRAALVAGATVAAKYLVSGLAGRALIVAGILAFCEVFTPLNQLTGLFKKP